jgi:tetratricopeptide (TPR) repeat protein
MKTKRLLPSIFLAGKVALANFLLAPGLYAALDPAVENLNQLVSQNRFIEAYELSVRMLEEFEGDPEFDFLYGLSALEAGRPSEAVFAFERLTFIYPDQQRVKLELARAQFQSNNLPVARQLFNEVLAGDPTENVRANIQAFLQRIDEKERSIAGSFTWFINSNIGSDSNINSATELGIISTPIGDVELSPTGRSIDDNFMDFGTGFNYVKPINKVSAFNLAGNFSLRNNLDRDEFDIGVYSFEGSYAHLVRDMRLSYGARAQMIQLDGNEFQRSGSLIATLQRNAGNGWSQAFTGAYTAVRFDNRLNSNASLRDVNQLLLSGMLGKSSGNFNHAVSVYYGTESVTRSVAKDNAQNFYGIAFSEQYQFRPTHIPYLRISFHYSENKAPHVFFGRVREDNLFSSSLGWIWRALPNMNVTTDLTYMENDSTLDLFSYDRLRVQTGLRYQF